MICEKKIFPNSNPVVAVFDLDGTLTKKDTYIPFLLRVFKSRPGRLFHVSGLPFFLALFYMRLINNHRLKQIFLYVFLKGAEIEDILNVASEFVRALLKDGMNPVGLKLLHLHQKRGDRIILLTASFDIYVSIIAKHLGITEILCTRAEIFEDRYTGNYSGLNCHGFEKLRRIKLYLGNIKKKVFAYSDDISDLPLLQWAGKGFFVTPNKRSIRDGRCGFFQIIK